MANGNSTTHNPIFIVVMGVSGTGKSTLANALAKTLDMPYVEGDDLHPKSNIEKMSAGLPLTDEDREPWLRLIRTTAERVVVEELVRDKEKESPVGVVISSSALKKSYREILRRPIEPLASENLGGVSAWGWSYVLQTYFVFINGSKEVLMERLEKRPGHFMKASMLDSQLRTLESPVGEEGVVTVSMEDTTEEQVRIAVDGLNRLGCNLITN